MKKAFSSYEHPRSAELQNQYRSDNPIHVPYFCPGRHSLASQNALPYGAIGPYLNLQYIEIIDGPDPTRCPARAAPGNNASSAAPPMPFAAG